MAAQIGINSLSGYVMMRIMAQSFGLSEKKDAFDIAYSIPFLLMTAAGLYMIQPVISGVFLRLKERENSKAYIQSFFGGLVTIILGFSVPLTLISWLFAEQIVVLLAPDFSTETAFLAQQCFINLIPLVMTLGLSTLLSSILIAYGVPILAEITQLMSRFGFILYALTVDSLDVIDASMALSVASLAGLVLLLLLFNRHTPLSLRPAWPSIHDEFVVKTICGISGVIVATLLSQISMAVLRMHYVAAGPGNLASFSYAMSLISPLTVLLGQPLAATLGLSVSSETVSDEQFQRWIGKSVSIIFAASAAMTGLLFYFSPWIVWLLFERGNFDHEESARVIESFRMLSLSIPFHIATWMMTAPIMNRFTNTAFVTMNGLGYGVQISACLLIGTSFGATGVNIAYLLGVAVLTLTGLFISMKYRMQRSDQAASY